MQIILDINKHTFERLCKNHLVSHDEFEELRSALRNAVVIQSEETPRSLEFKYDLPGKESW